MQITIRLLASYRQFLPEGTSSKGGYASEVLPGAVVSDALTSLPLPAGEVYTFFVNGRHAERDQVLEEGDVLSVFPAVGGG
jgi:molybdopterin synthase sulfur carrier subunit